MAFTLWALLEAGLLIVNAICVLHEQRFLAKVGWASNNARGFGEPQGVREQVMNIIHSTRTVMRIPLIFVNIVVIAKKTATGLAEQSIIFKKHCLQPTQASFEIK